MKKVATGPESVLDGVFLRSPDAVLVLNEHGQLERMNPAAERLLATQQAKAAGRDLAGWLGFNPKQLEAGDRVPLRDTARPVEIWVRSDLGQLIPAEMTLISTRLEGRNRRVAYLRDLTRQKAWQRQLQHQATHDAMTKLPDHDRVQVLLNRAVAYATENQKAIAFVCLGLNRFGEVNKLFGHSAGDEVLQKLARRLQSTLGNNGVVGRLGGDCFGAFLTHSDSSVVQRLQVLLERAIEKPFQVGDATVEIDASMGMALFPEHAIDAPTLMRRADLALSRAKDERRSLVLFREDRDATSKWPVMLTAELRKAIKDHDLRVVYQPKLSARSEKIVGVEALVRWKHPKLGEIPPGEFIGVAESSGLIGSVTTFVLNETIDQCARWRSMGMDLGISLNISARNLIDAELLQTLHEKIESTGIPRHLLTLEITESVIMEDPRAALEVVSLLHELGMGISIDDFGTGYSSLAYMKKLPASELKIDQSFVRDVTWDEESLAIVRSTIDLAHDLGMKVVGEGVETPETWNTLRRLGCDVGQGFLFSRPLMAGELLQWLAHGAKWSGQEKEMPMGPVGQAGGAVSRAVTDTSTVGSKRLA